MITKDEKKTIISHYCGYEFYFVQSILHVVLHYHMLYHLLNILKTEKQ